MQVFVDAVAAFGKAYTLPSAYKVAGPLIVKLKLDTEELIKPIKESWPKSGCTLTMDGWTCLKSRGMICVIAQNDTARVILDCVDSKTAKKTGEYLAKLIQHAICEVGDSHVVQVVMDNAANNKRAANLLKDEYPQVFFTNCAAHVLDLMLHDMGKVKAVKRVLNQVHRVVMMVKGSASAVTLFRELFSQLALVRPGATRFGTQVIMIERFLEVKKTLKEMVISEEWKSVAVANTEEGQAIRGLLLEETFWDSVTAILGLMKPIYEVLRIFDRRSLVMGSVYGLMLEATVKTNEAATKAAAQLSKKTGLLPGNEKAAFLAAFKAIIANRWDGQLHNPLHALGWLLIPKNQYVGEIREDAELRAGAEEVFKARGGSVEMRTMLAVQLAAFHKGEGKLGSVDARWAATILVESGRLSAAEWWALYGGREEGIERRGEEGRKRGMGSRKRWEMATCDDATGCGGDGVRHGEMRDGWMSDGEVRDGEMRDGEVRDGEVRDGEVRDGEVRDGEMRDGEVRDGEVRDGEMRDGEMRDGEMRDWEMRDGEVREGEMIDGDMRDGEMRDAEMRDGEMRDEEVRHGEVRDGEMRHGETRDGEMREGEMRDGEMRDGETREGEMRDGETRVWGVA
ncbi:unnamed protein product [Closterium sp. NIES-65]|nr:unnamed protein product [Closterium sp. NIES-65]